MNKEFDVSCEKEYTSDSVVERGYKIYDEWNSFGFSSKKIVAFVERAVAFAQAKGSHFYYVQALSYLFALNMRVREKYNKFWKCLLFYFSWRRETNALRRNKNTLHIAESADFRMAIEVEIQRLREKLENEELNGKDDDTHGGKRNAKAEEEAVAKQADPQEQASEESLDEEIVENEDSMEASEEIPEEPIEQIPTEETIENTEVLQESLQEVAKEEVMPLTEEVQDEFKVENNVPDEESEPSIDKKEEAKTYNDAVDSPPLYEGDSRNQSDKKISFIDEVIIDNMIKGKEDFIKHNPVDDVKQNKEADRLHDTVSHQSEENKANDKDAYLYDKMLLSDKGGTQQTEKIESTQQTEKTEQIKADQPKEQIQNNNKAEPKEQEFKSLSEILEADTNPFSENNMIKELNNTISKESVEAIYQAQAEAMREQLIIASEELGIDAPVEIIGQQKPIQTQLTSNVSNRK